MTAESLPPSIARTPRLSRWVTVQPDGTITVRTGKVELGQGIATALAQIAAEELDVDVSRIRMAAANTATGPDEGLTSGSRSVQESGAAIRRAGAEAKAVLLFAAAARLGVDAEKLRVEDGQIIAETAEPLDLEPLDYWTLTQARADLLDVDATGEAPLRPPDRYRVVGTSTARSDIAAKLAAPTPVPIMQEWRDAPDIRQRPPAFIHDLSLPDQLFGRVVRPPSPGARLVSLDEAAATQPGVVKVVRDGQFIGVVAEREEVAVTAVDKLAAAAAWAERATLPDSARLPEFLRAQPAEDIEIDACADPTAERSAVQTMSASYSRPYLAHASIAPSCAVARWDGSEVTIWSHSQGIFRLRDAVAGALGLAAAQVAVHHVESAGSYGHNGADDAAFDAVLLARAVPGRPVQVQWSRSDELSWAPFGPAMAIDLRAGLDANGRVVSWHHEVWSGGHTSRPGYAGTPGLLAAAHVLGGSELVPATDPPASRGGLVRGALPLYEFADRRVLGHRVLAMPLRTSALRSLGTHANVFAAECFLDELAQAQGSDPVAYRLSYLTDPRARAVIEAASARAHWSDWVPTEGRGHGIGFARYHSGAYCAVVATVELDREVRVRRLTIAVDVGRAVNPDGVANQIEGGAIQAASWTVRERVTFDRTRVTSTTWETYPILRFSEVPVVDVEIISRPEEPSVGAGEVAAGPTAAAIGNAVADGLGVRIRELPLTPETVIAALS
jgi:CO/xanthine dehydrogenase Mo-binding subunit